MDRTDTEILSELFTETIREWLDEETLAEIDRRNDSEKYKTENLCATHDFCDPNQAMINSIEALGQEFDTQDEKQGLAIDKAWEISKRRGFSRKLVLS